MKRTIVAALLGLVLAAGPASANGWGPGYFQGNLGVRANWGQGCAPGGCGGCPGPSPGVLGPWYLYWPYEAHFMAPAHPQFPYWPSLNTLPGGAPAAVQPSPGSYPAYWH